MLRFILLSLLAFQATSFKNIRHTMKKESTIPRNLMIFNYQYEHIEQGNFATDKFLSMVEGMKDTEDCFIVFYADWCPDCRAVPSIMQGLQDAFSEGKEPVVFACDIGEDKYVWQAGEHKFKQPDSLNLNGIPTLMRWGGGKEQTRLESGLTDGKAMKQGGDALVRLIVKDFVEKQ